MTGTLTEEATFDLTYEGLVAAHAEGDTKDSPTVLRIHGENVIYKIAAADMDLRNPVRATVTVDGVQIAQGRMRINEAMNEPGCADGCCGGFDPAELMVGDVDVLEHLNSLHGGEHEVRIYGQGYVPPKVDVTFAHHTWSPVKAAPGDRMVLSLDVAKKLRYRVTTASRDRIDALARREWSALRA